MYRREQNEGAVWVNSPSENVIHGVTKEEAVESLLPHFSSEKVTPTAKPKKGVTQ